MDIIIREMDPSEAQEVRKLGRRAFEGLESLWVSKPEKALVAIKDGKIVGAILYNFMTSKGKKIGYMDYGFVDPNYHKEGIGRILYKESMEYLWRQGCVVLTAVVKDDNVGSWASLLKNDFVRVAISDLVREFGFAGALQHYFRTPLCIAPGMEYYVALKDEKCASSKGENRKEIASYLLINLLMFLIILMVNPQNTLDFLTAYMIYFVGSIGASYVGTLFSKRGWKFRLNNGGLLMCALINLIGIYPMIGNWYPEHYEKTKDFRRDMGITALCGWIFVLALTAIPVFFATEHIIFGYTYRLGLVFLIYRIFAIYPFESFGGKRLYEWNKGIYLVMSALSVAVLVVGQILR